MDPTLDALEAPLRRGRLEQILGWVTVAFLAAVAVLTAFFAVVLLPPVLHLEVLARLAGSFALAGPGNYLLALYAGRAVRAPRVAAIPAGLWLATVVALSAGRPEGDNAYLLHSYQGLALAPVGILGFATGMVRASRHPWPVTPRRTVPVPPAEDATAASAVQAPPESADS
jgi:hypothetical protein